MKLLNYSIFDWILNKGSLVESGPCYFYTFNFSGVISDQLLLETGSSVDAILFSTLNGDTGLNPAFAGTYANAASESPEDLAAASHTVYITPTVMSTLVDTTFRGVVWQYRKNGVWQRVDQGVYTPVNFYLNNAFKLNSDFNLYEGL